ncbi:regulatory protein MerR [Gottschalkia purinilytica]|uniref:Regulatory protein MerR n=1 Tax=Gottschalkia purinilytica TaxID=1503 RepID=A0A0L0WBP9_GOTPU|nr:MerR family transcriptional regulator [Gottschalkia purinilytica]KNF08949.1 regulatory protein MerR [Gottschalkia purinilytica]
MFDAEKEYSISEISEVTGYPTHVLRYYEKEFDLKIPRNESNHRYYTYKEIETFNYIKTLQEKGFTNKQIKLILDSPEMILNEEEVSVTSLMKKDSDLTLNYEDMFDFLKEIIVDELHPKLLERENQSVEAISDLKEEIIQLRTEINSKERDVLICENAKLKMQIKEKAYEMAQMNEELRREKESKKGFFKRLFKSKK